MIINSSSFTLPSDIHTIPVSTGTGTGIGLEGGPTTVPERVRRALMRACGTRSELVSFPAAGTMVPERVLLAVDRTGGGGKAKSDARMVDARLLLGT